MGAWGAGSWWGGRLRRLPCGAREAGPRQNSLRSLRSLRSNSCRESVHEACPVLRQGTRPASLRSSAPHKSPAPQAPIHDAWKGWWCIVDRGGSTAVAQPERRTGSRQGGGGAPVERREAQGGRAACLPKDRHASSSDSAQLFERSERSERSEFCAGPAARASQGSRRSRPLHRSATAPLRGPGPDHKKPSASQPRHRLKPFSTRSLRLRHRPPILRRHRQHHIDLPRPRRAEVRRHHLRPPVVR